jgi:prophage maintenance system killer protein
VVRDEGTVYWISDGVRDCARAGDPPWQVAGLALYRTVTGHAFIDCNHRTGWLLCQTLMELAGFELVRPTNEVVDFVKSIDARDREVDEVVEWVRHSFLRLA